MTPIDQPNDLREYYQNRGVVGEYMQRRTAQPLNGVLHRSQVRFLRRVMAERRFHRVLEIACGPGRLTAEMRNVGFGVAIDTSAVMLEMALRRVDGRAGSWSFLRTDAFLLPFRSEMFDAVYSLRFVRHFQLEHRQHLYAEVRHVLRSGGFFIVDGLNRDVSLPYRVKSGLERYHIHDVLYRREEIEAELKEAGFRIVAVEGYMKHYSLQRRLNRLRRVKLDVLATALIQSLEHVPGGNPLNWVFLCEKTPA
jgi:SAM-dependent methyltransferase